MLGLSWPRGVFVHDYSLQESGMRSQYDLGVRVLRLMDKPGAKLTLAKIAKRLIPGRFRKNPKDATRMVNVSVW